jgi:predicted dehydrogenase
VILVSIRVGILGAGSISDYHIVGLQAAGAEVVAISSRTEPHARQKAQQYGIASYTTDYQALLARDDIEAVVIATPDYLHGEHATAAAQARKVILLQKPMAPTSAECRQIIHAAEEARVSLYVSFMHRYFPEITMLRDLLARNALGDIYSIRLRNATPGATWADWFYSQQQVGGGVALQLGIHGIDLLRHIFGEIAAVCAVKALMKTKRQLADGRLIVPDNDDTVLAIYRLKSGVMVSHEMIYNEVAGTDRFRIEIYGERGTAWLRTEKGALALHSPAYSGQDDWIVPDLTPEPVGLRQHRHWLAMVRGDSPPDHSAQDGLMCVRIAEAIYRSAASGRVEAI